MSVHQYARMIEVPRQGTKSETVVVTAVSPFDSNAFAATVRRLGLGTDAGHTRILSQDQFWSEFGPDTAGDIYAIPAAASTAV